MKRRSYLLPALSLAVVATLAGACSSSGSKTTVTTAANAPTTTVAAATGQTADIHMEPGRSSCPSGGTDGPAHGSVSFSTANGIIAEVSLKGAAPSHAYKVHVIQCQGATDSGSTVGTFETDGEGNGTFHSDPVKKTAGFDHAFVGLDGGDGQTYATSAEPI